MFIEHLVYDNVPNAGDRAVNKTTKLPALLELAVEYRPSKQVID